MTSLLSSVVAKIFLVGKYKKKAGLVWQHYCKDHIITFVMHDSVFSLFAFAIISYFHELAQAVINQLDNSRLQLSFMQASDPRRVPGANISV